MKYHFIGIGGTGMGALAGLLRAANHDVRGSDSAVYPPMSDQLESMNIPVFEGFSPENLDWGPDVVVVGNACRRDHVEVAAATERGLALTSLPALLGENFLAASHAVVIAGTHGKTTTSSLVAHIFVAAGRDPGVFVGGVPRNLGRGWRLGGGAEFVVEGDEYDSAFFDKQSKFLHYHPKTAILTSVELDHVDIFSSMDAIRATFAAFVAQIPPDGLLVVAADQPEAMAIATQHAQCRVETYAVRVPDRDEDKDLSDVTWVADKVTYLKSGRSRFELSRSGERYERFESLLVGDHNIGDAVAAIAVAHDRGVSVADIRAGLHAFAGVARRQEVCGVAQGVYVVDDYAHHPTAIRETLRGLRKRFSRRRLVAVFEPRSATCRRSTFQNEFVEALSHADAVVVGRLFRPEGIPPEERLDPAKLALELHQNRTPASFIEDVDEVVRHLVDNARPGDVIAVLSSGAFDGLHGKLLAALGDPVRPATPSDMAEIRAIAGQFGLLEAGLDDGAHGNFYVLHNETGFVGCIGLEVFGEAAILRSLAVKPEARGVGYGWLLADTVISVARHRGVRRIYLLTENASDFFANRLGFRVIDIATVTPAIADSVTFREQRDRGVTAMRFDL